MSNLFTSRKSFRLVTLCAALTALPLTAMAADASSEITAAATHAGFAAKATTLDMVHAHMHHALNCLVGPGGNGFDATALNPCKNSGNGAIPDTADAAKKEALDKVAAMLRTQVMGDDLAMGQKAAAYIEGELNKLK